MLCTHIVRQEAAVLRTARSAVLTNNIYGSYTYENILTNTTAFAVPVVLLARLAVDDREAGLGLGAALLKDALSRAVQAADVAGARAVLVHAIDEEARAFYKHFGFDDTPVGPLQLMSLIADLRKAMYLFPPTLLTPS